MAAISGEMEGAFRPLPAQQCAAERAFSFAVHLCFPACFRSDMTSVLGKFIRKRVYRPAPLLPPG